MKWVKNMKPKWPVVLVQCGKGKNTKVCAWRHSTNVWSDLEISNWQWRVEGRPTWCPEEDCVYKRNFFLQGGVSEVFSSLVRSTVNSVTRGNVNAIAWFLKETRVDWMLFLSIMILFSCKIQSDFIRENGLALELVCSELCLKVHQFHLEFKSERWYKNLGWH